jgi:predicted class III extradiol MEMO1 family dioxygenase
MSNAIQVARIRPPAVAGLFYPHDPRELRAVLDDCSAQAARLATPSAARSSMPKALIVPHVVAADFPHAREHSLEVHLPFLQVLLGEFRVLPIATGDATALGGCHGVGMHLGRCGTLSGRRLWRLRTVRELVL